ncbi:MEDS domain-containing protein [Stigmatella sp. ncwal1]|uniref:histidine kinase n=1 Tax=Stigmatella ashevillensis TaxID=2995309 RepID=A0ABT5D5H0_9BACT|nr:MEDS domain-containing protein [Stigmatella ashevillena]MDC0708915.1 MEDS domain-containing protein [Stigmatella ashevillena]
MFSPSLTPSGIPAIGAIPWGSHFCQFYSTAEELVELLVPFFKAGLERNEQCLWVTEDVLGVSVAKEALRKEVPQLEAYLQEGRIEILGHQEWSLRHRHLSAQEKIHAWLGYKEQALARGRDGLRLTGGPCWLEFLEWSDFVTYEAKVNEVFPRHEIISLCSICLSQCRPEGILDVVRNHQLSLARHEAQWEVLESSTLKKAKEELFQTNAQLDLRVRERTAALEASLQVRNRAEQEALAAVRARDEFLSMASHELKTPLTSLKLQLELVKGAMAGADSALLQRLVSKLRTMERQIQRLQALNGSLLDVATLDGGRMHMDFQWVDLSSLIEEAVERLAPDFERAGCEVRLEAESEAQGQWDPMRLDQVVVNLLSNAAKYGAGKPIHILLQRNGNRVSLAVKDQGIGISSEAQARLFRKFERAVPARHYGGLGLGLYISRMLVEAMGGTLQVDSRVGQGSTFTVSLPCGSERHAAVSPEVFQAR